MRWRAASTRSFWSAISGADPEIRRLSSGDPVVNLRIATSESWRDKNSGERKEKTEWHNVVIFNENLAKVAEQYLKKGAKVYIEGQLQTRKWEDQSGQNRYTTEIVLQKFRGELQMLDAAGRAARRPGRLFRRRARLRFRPVERPATIMPAAARLAAAAAAAAVSRDLDDEIPF